MVPILCPARRQCFHSGKGVENRKLKPKIKPKFSLRYHLGSNPIQSCFKQPVHLSYFNSHLLRFFMFATFHRVDEPAAGLTLELDCAKNDEASAT